jgi:aryl-alcohol dehydrogenase (NADP+)
LKYGNADHEDCTRIIHAALDAGINFIDTADRYSSGESEQIVGKALKGRRDDVVLATKFHMPMGNDPNHQGASRRWIMRAVEGSLRRLGTEWIDIYQMHIPSVGTDIEETLSALTDAVHQGKVRTIGSSNFQGSDIIEARWTAERRGCERFMCQQVPYSIFVRGIERDVLPVCERYGIGVVVWGPLNSAWLSSRYRTERRTGMRAEHQPSLYDPDRPEVQRKFQLLDDLDKLAADAGLTLTQLAHGFVLAHPAVTSAIIGPRTMEQFRDSLTSAEVQLDNTTLDRIDALVTPGVNIHPDDTGYNPPWLTEPWYRRRILRGGPFTT